MKLYTDNSLSLTFTLFSVVFYGTAMDDKKPSFSKPILALSKLRQSSPVPLQEQRSQSFVEPKNLSLCLRNYSGNFQKKISYEQAGLSPVLKSMINLKSEENKHTFDACIHDDAIKVFVEYLQAYGTCDVVSPRPSDKGKPRQQLIEKHIISKKFSVLSDVLTLAEKYQVVTLTNAVKYALVAKILQHHDSENNVATDIESLLHRYGLGKLFMVMKDNLVKNPRFYRDDPYSIAQEKKVSDVTLSPDARHLVITAHKQDRTYLSTFYTCCGSSTILKTFLTRKGKDAVLFTPDSAFCVVCSDDEFKMIDMSSLSVVKDFKGDVEDPYYFYAMSPNGMFLLVSSVSGKGVLYERSSDKGIFEATDKIFTVPCCGSKPVFTPDSTELIVSDRSVVCRYDCATGKELQKKDFGKAVKQIAVGKKGTCVVVVPGMCFMCQDVSFKKILLTVNVDTDVATRCFFNHDGSLCALTTGRKCYVYGCDNGTLKFLQMNTCRYLISQGAFFFFFSYLMLCDDFTCDVYDCCDKNLLKMINLMCLDGATIVVSNDGSHVIVTCENTSTVYGAYPLQAFFKVMTELKKK